LIDGLPDLPTTVVGSYPAAPAGAALLRYCREGVDPYAESLEQAVEAQLSAGIHLVSDGQTRNDMVRLFATRLSGIRMRSRPVIMGEIAFKSPITVNDQRMARRAIGGRAMLKGIITGPFTLARSCADEHYGSEERAAMAFAEALNCEAKALSAEVDLIQLDEPFFSVEMPEYAGSLVSAVLSGVDLPKALHVCGDVGRIFADLVELPVDVLDHEFAAHPDLLDMVADIDFCQKLGYGCVRSDVNAVESIAEISERIKKGVESFGHRRLLLDPDCGLRHLSPEVAKAKLENMVKARDLVMEDEGRDH
jgi:5-methyltetrahydropteroyltriglutamate--homocysteine methyltransferase